MAAPRVENNTGKRIVSLKRGVNKQNLILTEVYGLRWDDVVAGPEEVKARMTLLLRGQFDAWPKLDKLSDGQRLAGIIEGMKFLGKMHGLFQEPSKNERDKAAERKAIKRAALAIWKAGHDNPNVPNPTADDVIAVIAELELAGWDEHEPELRRDLEGMAASRDRNGPSDNR